MATKKQLAEIEEIAKWEATANGNTLLSFTHMSRNLSIYHKVPLERGRVLAYRRMKKKGMIKG